MMKSLTAEEVLALNADDLRELLNELMYEHWIDMPFDKLNKVQRLLFLCLSLEDTCQADGILSLTDSEDVFFALPELCVHLQTLGAKETARALQKFVGLLPKNTFRDHIMPDWEWFWKSKLRAWRIKKCDTCISGYPDGVMKVLYHRYIANTQGAAELLMDMR